MPRRLDAATIARDSEAAKMRIDGKTYDQIAVALGYPNRGVAYRAVQRFLQATAQETADELRALELERLDRLYQAGMQVLEAKHYTVQKDGVIWHDGKPLEDDGPVLAAIDRLLKIQDRRAKLLGLDAPTKVEVRTVGQIEAEIAELERRVAHNNSAEAGDVR
ncbi:hypothetical protein [Frankia sp. AgW1.1]|uniref:hypothetical protein n=1 Tax=Frankia sp. AgW1.1 TaxID=1836971 RepID=UPI001933EA86|nr:hypothetical protein [Frankia sp. AgW1.1]MBL7487105.1 hypothetical protein [Frankia sp. AgW1.1]